MIKSGQIYKHFKGNLYEVIGTGVHTETNERLVFYKSYNSENEIIYARPTVMFDGFVVNSYINQNDTHTDYGKYLKRFTLIGSINEIDDYDEDSDTPIETLE